MQNNSGCHKKDFFAMVKAEERARGVPSTYNVASDVFANARDSSINFLEDGFRLSACNI